MAKWFWVIAMLAACENKEPRPTPAPTNHKGPAAPVAKTPAPRPKIDGPAITPAITKSIAFVVPKEATWWGEFNLACYRAAMSLTGTRSAAEAFERLSPNMPAAMRAAEIDLGNDLAAAGGFDCAGSPCLYVALAMKRPEAMPDVLKTLLPQFPSRDLGKGHYTVDTPGIKGTRTIHVRAVPIQWTVDPPDDEWSRYAGRATHVIFIIGVDGKNIDIDPLASLADAQTARSRVEDAEGVLADKRGRCMIGGVGPRDFQPGFKLDRARFALALPPAAKPDPLMELLASKRTLDFEVELVLSPAAKDATVKKWVEQGRQWFGTIGAQVRAGFAGSPGVDVYFDMLTLIGQRGFKTELAGKSLRFSWRTDRVPRADLEAIETRLQAMLGP